MSIIISSLKNNTGKHLLVLFILCLGTGACKTPKVVKNVMSSPEYKPVVSAIPFYPLRNDKDLDVLINEIGDSRIVLLGEATHGTAEFYEWRAAISKRLIQEKGFNIIGAEGDWSSSLQINNFIKGEKKDSAAAITLLQQFNRWPQWLWANYEIASFITWLNENNQNRKSNKISFFGLDLFSFWQPAAEQIPALHDTLVLPAATRVKKCFEQYDNNSLAYTKMVTQHAAAECTSAVNQYRKAVQKYLSVKRVKNEEDFLLEQSALLATNGEKYFRNPSVNRVETWNLRDNYMAETIKRLLTFYGPDSKAIIWAHNTHVGDAHASDMFFSNKTNVGELMRKEFGARQVFITGFGSYSGSFIAAEKWGGAYEIMKVPAAVPKSFEDMLHKDSAVDKIILSKDIKDNKLFEHWVGNRAIGVVNNPWQLGSFIGSLIPKRYDAFIYIDSTHAIHPLNFAKSKAE